MPPAEKLKTGDLDGALAELKELVRDNPADPKHRIFLFQLLAVRGDWARALTQLEVVRDLDVSAMPMVQTYQQALGCEALRAEVFAGRRSPLVFGDPSEWIALLLEGLRMAAQEKYTESGGLRERAFEAAPATAGTLDGEPFDWIADADVRLGPVLEAVIAGSYYWVPFQHIREVRIEEPADLRDLVWTPAFFTWSNGGEAAGLIPTRYPRSEASDDSAILMARKTDWIEYGADFQIGLGQRMLATDNREYPLMDVRLIRIEDDGSTDTSPSQG